MNQMPSHAEQLINEVRLLYQSLVLIGDEVHAGSNISMGMRAVLEFLSRNGDATVPHIARERRVTRQRIQTLVNSLRELELVEPKDNPASRRSPLITLTEAGRATIADMRRLEGRQMRLSVSDQKLQEAAETLSKVRISLEKGRR